jgi:hypothetical protein
MKIEETNISLPRYTNKLYIYINLRDKFYYKICWNNKDQELLYLERGGYFHEYIRNEEGEILKFNEHGE